MADAARKLRIIGYSERGITNSLFYEISYSSQPVSLLEKLLSLVRFPYVGQQSIQISSAKILIEQSFSDFGDADVVLLTETGTQHVSNYGYICWSEIKGFCSQYNLENTLGVVFTFNEGQTY
jgi:hypothetical protein